MPFDTRSLAERLTKSWTFRRRLPADVGGAPIIVSTAGGLKYIAKPMAAVDPVLLRNVREVVRPGDTVWDIGANVGLFTFAAAGVAGGRGEVLSFEPDVWLVQLLRRSAALQGPETAPVRIIPTGIGATIALREFHISSRARAANSLAEYGSTQFGVVSEKQTIPVFNVDWLLASLPSPQVVKIDVEGAEVEVLAGQTRLLSSTRPVIVCEVAPANGPAVTGILMACDYRLFDGNRELGVASEVAAATWNTIAIPQERVSELVVSP